MLAEQGYRKLQEVGGVFTKLMQFCFLQSWAYNQFAKMPENSPTSHLSPQTHRSKEPPRRDCYAGCGLLLGLDDTLVIKKTLEDVVLAVQDEDSGHYQGDIHTQMVSDQNCLRFGHLGEGLT